MYVTPDHWSYNKPFFIHKNVCVGRGSYVVRIRRTNAGEILTGS